MVGVGGANGGGSFLAQYLTVEIKVLTLYAKRLAFDCFISDQCPNIYTAIVKVILLITN